MQIVDEVLNVLHYVWHHPANRGRRLRQLIRAVRFQYRGRIRKRRTLVKVGSRARLWAELHHSAGSKVVYANPPDWPEMVVWQRALRPGDLFIDVGANVGVYSLLAAECGARVIAIEPEPSIVERLRENVALNDFHIEVVEAAVTNRPGRVSFDIGRDTRGAMSSATGLGTRLVAATSIDEVLGASTAAGIKVDVEGHERLVLEGATRALQEHRIQILQLEWNDASERALGESRAPVAELLHRFGYERCEPTEDGQLVPSDRLASGADMFARPRPV